MNHDSSGNTAQGWAEITELITAGRYIPTLNLHGAITKNTCEDTTDCPSHGFCYNKAVAQLLPYSLETLQRV